MLQVELAKLGALGEAVHDGDLVVVQVYLDEVGQAMESTGHISQEVVLQVNVQQCWTLAGQDGLVGVFGIRHAYCGQVFICHLQMRLLTKVGCMVDHRLRCNLAKQQLHSDGLRRSGHIRRRHLEHLFRLLQRAIILSCCQVELRLILLVQRGLHGDVGAILAYIIAVDFYCGINLVEKTGGVFCDSQLLQRIDLDKTERLRIVKAVIEELLEVFRPDARVLCHKHEKAMLNKRLLTVLTLLFRRSLHDGS